MANQLPKKSPVFILCEDIRIEVGNKASFLGVFMGDIIVHPDPNINDNIVLPSISCVFTFKDGHGEFDGEIGLKYPDGTDIIKNPYGKVLMTNSEPLNLALKFGNLKVIEGTYTAWARLDKEIYEEKFKISIFKN